MSVYDEQYMQMRFINYLNWRKIRCNHSPNEGRRSPQEGNKLKKMGMSKGFPDVEIPLPSGDKHGLYIEFKTETGRLTPEQKEWIDYFNTHNYTAKVARSDVEAIKILNAYLGEQKNE